MQPLALSITAGGRRVIRWSRALTRSQNSTHAASSAAKSSYSPRRLCLVGTRSALAILTVASEPPLLSGSAGTQVAIGNP
jgi:hypothetical protein